jgi:hypothetical protein
MNSLPGQNEVRASGVGLDDAVQQFTARREGAPCGIALHALLPGLHHEMMVMILIDHAASVWVQVYHQSGDNMRIGGWCRWRAISCKRSICS